MSDSPRPIAEEELHAYVDGRLDESRLPAVLRYLQEHPETAHRVAAYQAQRETLRNALGGVAAEPIPPQLSLERLVQERLSRQWRLWPAAACVLIGLGLGAAGGWFLRNGTTAPNPAVIALLAREAVANHVVYSADKRRPTELGATQRDDLARWVSNRLNHPVSPPDLSTEGYNYMGGRLAATPDGPAGLFMYDNDQGVRITVFVLPLHAAASAPIQHVDFAHVDGCAWIDKNIGYTVVGNLPPAELRRLAEIVRRQFETST
jgi:anti-sigma factor RsiW